MKKFGEKNIVFMEILALYNLCTNIIACKKNHQIFHRKKKSQILPYFCVYIIPVLISKYYSNFYTTYIYTFLDFLFFDERKKN